MTALMARWWAVLTGNYCYWRLELVEGHPPRSKGVIRVTLYYPTKDEVDQSVRGMVALRAAGWEVVSQYVPEGRGDQCLTTSSVPRRNHRTGRGYSSPSR